MTGYPRPKGSRIKEPIPSGPFMCWIEDRIAYYHRLYGSSDSSPAAKRVVREIGWDRDHADTGPRRLYRYRYGRSETRRGQVNGKRGPSMVLPMPFFERSVVEDALHNAGFELCEVYDPVMYPAMYSDIPLEDERWCPSCQDHCTPIYSVCPWCEWSFLPPEQRSLAA